MRQTILTIALGALALSAGAQTGTTMLVGDATYHVDTLFHAKVGPGTTQTQLRLEGSPGNLDVFYLTIDKSTPGVSIRAVCSTDKVAGNERTSAMAQRKTTETVDYFAGSNADFYWTSGVATNGSSKVGTPTYSCAVDREVYKSSSDGYQFSVDVNGVARVCRLNFDNGTATVGDKVTLFKGVNLTDAASNGITLYTPRFWGSPNQGWYDGKCKQVSAKLAPGSDPFQGGGKFKLLVTSAPTTDGDMPVPADGFVIFARGNSTSGCNTGADDFVGSLKEGDIVEFDHKILTPEGEAIQPTAIVSGNPKNIGGGVKLNSEAERGDASARHPRTCIGVSADGNKVIMMVVDGRSGSSVGVTTGYLADIMLFAGAHEAVNLDGGGSSTLYTKALGVRNHCSDGTERAVGNGIFAVLEGDDIADTDIVEIAFEDFHLTMPYQGVYTPVVYGFNKYGKCVTTDLKGYTVSCPGGEAINEGGSFLALTPGTYPLTINYNGATATMPVTIQQTAPTDAKYSKVILNATREWSIDLVSDVNGKPMPVYAPAFEWESDNPEVVTVTTDGVAKGVSEGTATLTGTLGDNTVTVEVTVEVPKAVTMMVDGANVTDNWAFSKVSVSNGYTATALDNGFAVDFKLSSTRSPSFTAKLDRTAYSLPEALQLRFKPVGFTVTRVVSQIKAANGDRSVTVSTDETVEPGADKTITYNLADYFDPTDIGIYPVTFNSAVFYLKGSTKTDYRLEVPGVEAVYDESTLGVEDIRADRVNDAAERWYTPMGVPVANPTAPGLYISRSRKILVR